MGYADVYEENTVSIFSFLMYSTFLAHSLPPQSNEKYKY
jgi:hypothetical protein